MGKTLIQPRHPGENHKHDRDPDQIANIILEEGELALYAKEHSQNGSTYIDADVIAFHFDVTFSRAERAKNLLESHLPEAKIERAAAEDWGDD